MSAGDGWCFTPPSAQLQNATFSSHPSTYTKSGETETKGEFWKSKGGKTTQQNPNGHPGIALPGDGHPGKGHGPAKGAPQCQQPPPVSLGGHQPQDLPPTLTLKCTNVDLNDGKRSGWLTKSHFQVHIHGGNQLDGKRVWMSSVSLLLL